MVECNILPSHGALMWGFIHSHVGVSVGTPGLAMLLLRATVATTYLPLFNLKKCLPMLTSSLRWQHFFNLALRFSPFIALCLCGKKSS